MKRAASLLAVVVPLIATASTLPPGPDPCEPQPPQENAEGRSDSLWNIWIDASHSDSLRLEACRLYLWEGPLFRDPDSAYVLASTLHDSAMHMGMKVFMSAALNMQAITKAIQGDHAAAIDHYQRALELSREAGDRKGQATALKNIGGSHYMMDEPYNAVQYYEQAMALLGATGDRMEANILSSMALAYVKMDDHEKADAHARRALTIAENVADRKEILYACTVLGDNLVSLGRTEEAMPFYQRALALAEELDDIRNISAALRGLSHVHEERGEFGKAIALEERGLAIALGLGDRSLAEQCYVDLYETYKRAGRHAEALEMLEHYLELHDETLSDENKTALVRQKMQSDFDLKEAMLHAEQEKKAAIAAQEIHRQKVVRYFYLGVALLLLAGSGAWYLADRKRRTERFHKEAAELQTQVLRAQMNPHFIFNALNSINAFVQRNDPDGASSYLSKFARVMRGVLENSRHREVTLNEDLEVLRGYIELERKRMDDRFDYSIEVDATIDADRVLVPPLVVQPLVENAIWHGLAMKSGNGHIALKVEQQGEQLTWTVEDDGVGRNATTQTVNDEPSHGGEVKRTSLGTAITKSRLELLQQRFGGRAGFWYEDLVEGTRVVVEMPLIPA